MSVHFTADRPWWSADIGYLDDDSTYAPLDPIRVTRARGHKESISSSSYTSSVKSADVDYVDLPAGYYEALIYYNEYGSLPPKAQRTKGTYVCSACHEVGHNRRTCVTRHA
jgi:hypothetical protein